MALLVNLILMVGMLALVGYPLMQDVPKQGAAGKAPTADSGVSFDARAATLAETELDQALGKAQSEDVSDITKRNG